MLQGIGFVPKLRSKIGVVERPGLIFCFFTFFQLKVCKIVVFGLGCIRAWLYSGSVVFGLGCIRAWLYSGLVVFGLGCLLPIAYCLFPIAYAWLDAFGVLDAYCLRMHPAAECIPRQYAFRGSMQSRPNTTKPEYNQARIQPSPNTTKPEYNDFTYFYLKKRKKSKNELRTLYYTIF